MIKLNKSYKFRIYPNKEQEIQIQKTFGSCRFIYNYYLDKRIKKYDIDKITFNYYDCSKDLINLKTEFDWLKDIDSTSLQSSLKDLDTAYSNFFRNIKKSKDCGFPKFKSKKNNHKSYKTKKNGNKSDNIQVLSNKIKLPKLKLVKCKVSKQIEGRILSATISQNPSGKYFVSICCTDINIPNLNKTGTVIGIDLGLKEFLVTSDNQHISNPKYLRQSEKKLTKLQKELSRKSIGSKNKNKARIKVARQHEKIVNQRNDFLHKLSTQIVSDYDIICLENLKVSNMIKNHKLSKSISDASWSEFVRQLEYKSLWYNKVIQKIDSFYPSSQLCSTCGYKNINTKNLNIRTWECPQCKTIHDRDYNASINILNEGLRLLTA